MVKIWGPSDGPTGDPDGFDPSEVPDDVQFPFYMVQASVSGGTCPFW